jgi:hypothetical protein
LKAIFVRSGDRLTIPSEFFTTSTTNQMARDVLATRGENKTEVVDPQTTYFGAPLSTNSLVVP